MARWHYDADIRKADEQTELNWLKSGYVIKRGRKGVTKYTNGFCQQMAVFYSPDDVREDSEKAAARLQKLHEEDLRRRRKARHDKKLMQQRKVSEWSRFLRQQSRSSFSIARRAALTVAGMSSCPYPGRFLTASYGRLMNRHSISTGQKIPIRFPKEPLK